MYLGGMIGCPLVVHYWADLQSVHGFRCCDNIVPNAKCDVSEYLYSLCAWFARLYSTVLGSCVRKKWHKGINARSFKSPVMDEEE